MSKFETEIWKEIIVIHALFPRHLKAYVLFLARLVRETP